MGNDPHIVSTISSLEDAVIRSVHFLQLSKWTTDSCLINGISSFFMEFERIPNSMLDLFSTPVIPKSPFG